MSEKYEISVSVLPSAHDCMRRSASKAFGSRKPRESKLGKLIESAGYSFDKMRTGKSFAPILGTAIHKVVETAINGDDLPNSLDAGMADLYENAEGAEGDSTTPNLAMAEHQLKLIGTYIYNHVLPDLNIVFCEKHIVAPFNDEVNWSGHIDIGCLTDEKKLSINDWKFGKGGTGYEAQFGGYSFLADKEGFDISDEHYIQHLPRLKTKVNHEVIPINNSKAVALALATGKHIARAIKDFERTGDPDVFIANPASKLCSKKFCPAYGTEFCNVTGGN